MAKIKANDFDNDIFDEFSKSKKKKKKKNKKKKNKKKNKKKKNKNNLKLPNIENSGYIGNSWDTANEIYSYKYNKSILNNFLNKFNINLDVESKIGVSVKDETIASLINIGTALITKLITKK